MNTIFGASRFFGIAAGSNPTPARFYVPQDVGITIKRASKSLFGENQFAVAVAAGEAEVSGKVTMGRPNARILADLIAGVSGASTLILKEADKESGTVPATSPYTITVANSATWTTDLGVLNADNAMNPMKRVASAPAAGQYSVAAGVYTFASTNASLNVKISYLYTVSQGEIVTMTNQPQGKTGAFNAVMVMPWGSDQDVLVLNSCINTNADWSTKQGDFGKPTFDYIAGVDDNDVLGTFSFAEAA